MASTDMQTWKLPGSLADEDIVPDIEDPPRDENRTCTTVSECLICKQCSALRAGYEGKDAWAPEHCEYCPEAQGPGGPLPGAIGSSSGLW